MPGALIGYGAKKVVKKVAAKRAAAKGTTKTAAQAAKHAERLAKIDRQNVSATTIGQDIRKGIAAMRNDVVQAERQLNRRMGTSVLPKAAGVGAAGGVAAATKKRKRRSR